jgi:hypothetical protein
MEGAFAVDGQRRQPGLTDPIASTFETAPPES